MWQMLFVKNQKNQLLELKFEEMITASDSFNTFDIGKYYVILPNNKKIQDNFINAFKKAKKVKPGFSYNSRDNDSWETVSSLKQKIKNLKLN